MFCTHTVVKHKFQHHLGQYILIGTMIDSVVRVAVCFSPVYYFPPVSSSSFSTKPNFLPIYYLYFFVFCIFMTML